VETIEMRATEIIRDLLDLLDKVEDQSSTEQHQDDEQRRMDQITDLQGCDAGATYANEPDERVGDITVVTTRAGGGMQEPKHPADIRGEHGRVYGGN
jgi:hypothetical protein